MKKDSKKPVKATTLKTELKTEMPLDVALPPGKLATALSEATGQVISTDRVRQALSRLPARRRRRVTLAELVACMIEELDG